jgi:hypothetical protein
MQVASAPSARYIWLSRVENVDGRGFGLSVCKLRLQQVKYDTLTFITGTSIVTVYIYYATLTTNVATNKVSCLPYCTTQCKQYTQCVSITGVCNICEPKPN